MIELRFFRKRYKMDQVYYAGDNDVYCRLYFKTLGELRHKWNHLMEADDHALEGETYSAWYVVVGKDYIITRDMLCGGAFDPDDIYCIAENYGKVVD